MNNNQSWFLRFLILGIVAVLVGVLIVVAINSDAVSVRTPAFTNGTPKVPVVDVDSRPGQESVFLDGVHDPLLSPPEEEFGYQVVPVPAGRVADPSETDLTPGELLIETLESGALRLWNFEAVAGETINVLLNPVGDFNPDFNLVAEIFAEDGTLITRVDNYGAGQPEPIQSLKMPASGNYTLWITEATFSQRGQYKLLLLTDFAKASYPLRIGIGQTILSNIEVGEWQPWIFAGGEGENVTIRAVPFDELSAGFDMRITVVAPDGTVLAERNNRGIHEDEDLIGLPLSQTGNYMIWVSDVGWDDAGNFLLTVTP